MLSLLLAIAVAQPTVYTDDPWYVDPQIRPRVFRSTGRGSRLGGSLAYFEFAPASGAGMGAPCSGAAITGAKGEAVTLTRASAATCTKGSDQAIAPGDVVKLTNNQPIVGNPNGAGLALLVEGTRTNSLLWSEGIDNVAWTKTGSGVAAPTVTADFATAPDGTTTAERLQIPATTVGQMSYVVQAGCPITNQDASFYLKGNGTSGVVDFTIEGSSRHTFQCNYVAATWIRCSAPDVNIGGVSLYVGNMSGAAYGNTARNAADILLWGVSCENGAYVTSYIPTTTIAAARAVTSATIALPATPGNVGSTAATFLSEHTGSSTATCGEWFFNIVSGRALYFTGTNITTYDGTAGAATAAGLTAGVAKRYWSSWSTANGWVVRNATDANQSTGAFTAGTWAPTSTLGIDQGGCQSDGWLSLMCWDNAEARCR